MSKHDAIIIGGGHNGLTAAAYLALAGKNVLVLERDDHFGGAAISTQAFTGVDARLSRYSYLVSMLPQRIIDDLKLDIRLAHREYSSYSPDPLEPNTGLLISHTPTPADFARVYAESDAAAWDAFYESTARLAEALFPTVLEPLPTRAEVERMLGADELEFVQRPLGHIINERFDSDLVRGVVATDGLIGTFADLDAASLEANVCFLYHVIGNETGDWNLPIGGMGAVSGELERAARLAGAHLHSGANVISVSPDGRVRYTIDGEEHTASAERVLANVAPAVLEQLVTASGSAVEPPAGRLWPEGAQVKVNLLLTRLPRLLDDAVAPEAAFGGTFHINETRRQLDAAFAAAFHGRIPDPLPCEIYCHTLSDPSILSPELHEAGYQTLTLFGLHVPDRLVDQHGNDVLRERLTEAALASLNSVLAEPIESIIATDAPGAPCIEVKTTRDIQDALNMPGGNIFHGPLSWPWLENDAPRATAAERWGVASAHPRILLCGSGAVRGGAVSGIGGHNAAMAVLEEA